MFRSGKITFVPPADPIFSTGRLRVELLGGDGEPMGELDLEADAIKSEEERRAIAIFAHHVDNAPRRVKHIEKFAGSEAILQDYQRARIQAAIMEDWNDWYLRQRSDQELYEGIDPGKVREFNMHR